MTLTTKSIPQYALFLVLALMTIGEDPSAADDLGVCAARASGLDLDSPTLPTPPSVDDNISCDWDYFAWNSFAALNWPADTRRGFPYLRRYEKGKLKGEYQRTFLNAANTDQAVWETFKLKREIFQTYPDKVWPGPEHTSTALIELATENRGFCSAADYDHAQSLDNERFLLTMGKYPLTSGHTTEVAGEALETAAQLCMGHVEDPVQACQQRRNKPACCKISGQAVAPRVWKGAATGGRPLYYEVRVNYDYFNYVVVENDYYDDTNALTDAILGKIDLPYRGSAVSTAGDDQPRRGNEVAYSPTECLSVYSDADARTPCQTGAVQIQSAWVQLPDLFDRDSHPPTDDPDRYHTTRAVFFEPSTEEQDKHCKRVGTFGLVGLDLMQRIHVRSANAGFKTGDGGFVFATWEHLDVLDDQQSGGNNHYSYVNSLENRTQSSNPASYPALTHALPVVPMNKDSRLLAPTQHANRNVYAQLDTKSVWRNYRLIGTQFRPVSDSAESIKIGQPYHLANLVIESSKGLQNFQGLPPRQPRIVPPQFAARPLSRARLVQPNPLRTFAHERKNMSFAGQAYNMGGCMGCHGVAQQNGYAFSFALLGGHHSADPMTQLGFDATPPALPAQTLKLAIGIPTTPTQSLDSVLDASSRSELVVVNPIEPGVVSQRWTLSTPPPGASALLAGSYTIENGDGLLLENDDKPNSPISASRAATERRFWELIPYPIRTPHNDDGRRVYEFKIRNKSNGLVMQHTSSSAGSKVIAAESQPRPATLEEDQQFRQQLWRIEIAPNAY